MKARIIVIVRGGVVQSIVVDDPDAVTVDVINNDDWECYRDSHYSQCPDHTQDEVAHYEALVSEAESLKEVY